MLTAKIPTQHQSIGLHGEYGPCSLWGTTMYIKFRWSQVVTALRCLRRLVAGFSMRRRRIGPRAVCVKFVMDEVALREGFLWRLRLAPTSIIPAALHTHLPMPNTLTRKTNGRDLGTAQKPMLYRK